MTTVWRPHVRREIPNIDDAKGEMEVREELTKGTKRKSAPNTGAVRARGEVSLEVQGVQRLSARSCALSVQGVRWGINLRARSSALYMQGVRWCMNLRAWSYSLSVQGVRWVTNMRARS